MRRFTVICGLTIFTLLLASPIYAGPVEFFATLTGAAEIPPSGSPGTGSAHVTFDPVLHTLHVQAVFSGLGSPDTAAQSARLVGPGGSGCKPTAPSRKTA